MTSYTADDGATGGGQGRCKVPARLEHVYSAVANGTGAPGQQPGHRNPNHHRQPQVGKTLTAGTSGITDSDGLNNVSYSYQWLADDADIAGATESTYALTNGDQGKAVNLPDGGNGNTDQRGHIRCGRSRTL